MVLFFEVSPQGTGISLGMAHILSSSSLYCFNCHSVKSCEFAVHSIFCKFDIVLLQEHWLLPHEQSLLNMFHRDLPSYAVSAVDVSSDIQNGQPYGSTAVLYRKSVLVGITHISSRYSKISGIILDSDAHKILIIKFCSTL